MAVFCSGSRIQDWFLWEAARSFPHIPWGQAIPRWTHLWPRLISSAILMDGTFGITYLRSMSGKNLQKSSWREEWVYVRAVPLPFPIQQVVSWPGPDVRHTPKHSLSPLHSWTEERKFNEEVMSWERSGRETIYYCHWKNSLSLVIWRQFTAVKKSEQDNE